MCTLRRRSSSFRSIAVDMSSVLGRHQNRLSICRVHAHPAAELFVASFVPALSTSRLSLFGDDVRIHHCWGGLWQVHYVWPNGKGDLLVAAERTRPPYDRLLSVVKRVPGSRASRPWLSLLGGGGGKRAPKTGGVGAGRGGAGRRGGGGFGERAVRGATAAAGSGGSSASGGPECTFARDVYF